LSKCRLQNQTIWYEISIQSVFCDDADKEQDRFGTKIKICNTNPINLNRNLQKLSGTHLSAEGKGRILAIPQQASQPTSRDPRGKKTIHQERNFDARNRGTDSQCTERKSADSKAAKVGPGRRIPRNYPARAQQERRHSPLSSRSCPSPNPLPPDCDAVRGALLLVPAG
jgi:hypothetical protein